MKFDKCFILILFLMLILSVSAVNATDINSTNDLINNREDVSPVSTTVDKNWTVNEFLDKYNTIQDNEVVYIQNGTGTPVDNIVLTQNGIKILSEGNVIFDGQQKDMHFQIKGNNVLIQGITFKNFHFTHIGGAIRWDGENGNVNNCTFNNNTAGDYYGGDGGAIYWNGNNGNVNNCTFNNNAIEYGGDGGAIYWNAENGTLTNCTFNNNTAGDWGGAIYWDGNNSNVDNCTFNNNIAACGGGAIYWGVLAM